LDAGASLELPPQASATAATAAIIPCTARMV
jgi:hypothetical protein